MNIDYVQLLLCFIIWVSSFVWNQHQNVSGNFDWLISNSKERMKQKQV